MTVWTVEKMAVLIPMPSAKVVTAMAVKAGCRRRLRTAWRKSPMTSADNRPASRFPGPPRPASESAPSTRFIALSALRARRNHRLGSQGLERVRGFRHAKTVFAHRSDVKLIAAAVPAQQGDPLVGARDHAGRIDSTQNRPQGQTRVAQAQRVLRIVAQVVGALAAIGNPIDTGQSLRAGVGLAGLPIQPAGPFRILRVIGRR